MLIEARNARGRDWHFRGGHSHLFLPTHHHERCHVHVGLPSCFRSEGIQSRFPSSAHSKLNRPPIHPRPSATRSITRSVRSRCASTNKLSSTTRPLSNSCSCIFLLFPIPPLSPFIRQCQLTDVLTSYPYRSKTHAEDAPEMAEMYFAYGKALLENAIVQNSVLGKEQEGGAAAEEGQ